MSKINYEFSEVVVVSEADFLRIYKFYLTADNSDILPPKKKKAVAEGKITLTVKEALKFFTPENPDSGYIKAFPLRFGKIGLFGFSPNDFPEDFPD